MDKRRPKGARQQLPEGAKEALKDALASPPPEGLPELSVEAAAKDLGVAQRMVLNLTKDAGKSSERLGRGSGRGQSGLDISPEDQVKLRALAAGGQGDPKKARRAEIILRSAAGQPVGAIAKELGIASGTVRNWRRRFTLEGLAGLSARQRPKPLPKTRPKPSRRLPSDTRLSVIALSKAPPPAGSAVWSGGLIAKELGIPPRSAWHILKEEGISFGGRLRRFRGSAER